MVNTIIRLIPILFLLLSFPARSDSVTVVTPEITIDTSRSSVTVKFNTRTVVRNQTAYLEALINHHMQVMHVGIEHDREVRCLAMNIYYEARGEPTLGQLAIANVTLNRQKDTNQTVCKVVYSSGQFEWTKHKKKAPVGESWWKALVIAWLAIKQPDIIIDVTEDSTYFHSYKHTPPLFKKFTHTVTIGNHRFYRENYIEIAEAPN